jgi:hypothetical protein
VNSNIITAKPTKCISLRLYKSSKQSRVAASSGVQITRSEPDYRAASQSIIEFGTKVTFIQSLYTDCVSQD